MKQLKWDETLSVQIQEIDDDHRKLLNLFNILNESIKKGETEEYISAILDELLCCTIWHFKHEERLMLQYSYGALDAHKKEHQELIDSAAKLKSKYEQQGYYLSDEDIKFLEHWLTGHILGSDMEMSEYLCEVM